MQKQARSTDYWRAFDQTGVKFPATIIVIGGGVDMRSIMKGSTWFLLSLLATGSLALADSAGIRTMAEITKNLNHFPSDADKAALKSIVDSDDSSEEEASIAMAISNIEHKVTEADAERLDDIVSDDEAGADARALAGILLTINHSPSDADKAKLETMIAGAQ
jgi:hypothetical protein